jgi:hypothetical protein
MCTGETYGSIAFVDGAVCMDAYGVFGHPKPTPQPRLAVVARFGIELHSFALPEKTARRGFHSGRQRLLTEFDMQVAQLTLIDR